MITKIKLPSKIITQDELKERHQIMESIKKGEPKNDFDYFLAVQRLSFLNGKHMSAILYVTAYN